MSAIAVAIRPLMLAYLLLVYLLLNGLASGAARESVKLTFGGTNVYPLDVLFGMMLLLVPLWALLRMAGHAPAIGITHNARIATSLVILFLAYHLIRFVLGFLDGVPAASLVRMLRSDFMAVFYFLPLMFVRDEKQLRNLFYAMIAVALLFPIGQLLFASRADAEWLVRGQGTYRLGYGDSAIPMGVGLIAIYVWERRFWLMALPAAGIVMVAHRSAFAAIFIALVVAAILKGKKLKMIAVMILGGALAGGLLFAMQHFTGEQVLDSGLERIGQTFEKTGTTEVRLRSISYMYERWLENPITGIGYGELYQLRELLAGTRGAAILHPHNFVLKAFVHYGLIGVVLLFSAIAYSLLMARKLSRHEQYHNVGVFLFAAQLYFLIFALMNTTLGTIGFFYWILVGCTFWYIGHVRVMQKQPMKVAAIDPEPGRDSVLSRKKPVKIGL